MTIRPIVSLNTAITKLTVAVDQLQKDIEGLTSKNSKAHERMWEHNEGQDGWLDDHEKRISQIEACEM
ncbi:MAG: hypothetical protein GX585_05085 [Clostridiales bacterium]|nr:hypothetical protein [Clostridiales bacterium]